MKTSNGSEVVGFSTHDWGAAAEVDVKRTNGLPVVEDSFFAVASPGFNLIWEQFLISTDGFFLTKVFFCD